MTDSTVEPVSGAQINAFISYASADREKAVEVCEGLEERGLSCWIAPRNVRAGAEFGEEISRGIRESRCLVLLLSDASNASPMVRREVERAVSLGKPVFPIRVEEVLPARSLEFFVSSTHWIDAWGGDLSAHIRRLADEIADERALDEALGVITSKRRRRVVTRATWTTVAALVIAVLSITIVVRGGGAVHPDKDPIRAMFAQYGYDIDAIGPDDFQAEIFWSYGRYPRIRVADSDPARAMTAFAWLEGRVGDRPWATLLAGTESPDTVEYLLNSGDLEEGGVFQVRMISDSLHQPGMINYGPYDLVLDFQAEYNRVMDEKLREIKAGAESSDWLQISWRWEIQYAFVREFCPFIEAIAFGTDPGTLNTVLELPLADSGPASMGFLTVGNDVDASALGRLLKSDIQPRFKDADQIYAQFTYIDGSKGPIQRTPSSEG